MGLIDRAMDVLEGGDLGFRIDERMTGSHEFEPGMGPPGSHPFEFVVSWGPDRLDRWLRPSEPDFMVQPMKGIVTAGGLCEAAPIEGTLALEYFESRRIRYSFRFEVDGTEYEHVGEKVNIRPWNLPVSHTTCFGVLKEVETGRLVSRSVTFFRMRSLLSFVTSFRLIWRSRDSDPEAESTAAGP